jgi:hypothetical protein
MDSSFFFGDTVFGKYVCTVTATEFVYYCGQKKWDINVIVLTFNVK